MGFCLSLPPMTPQWRHQTHLHFQTLEGPKTDGYFLCLTDLFSQTLNYAIKFDKYIQERILKYDLPRTYLYRGEHVGNRGLSEYPWKGGRMADEESFLSLML